MMKESEKKVSKNRDPNLAFAKAMKTSEALANIVGSDHFLRTEITKELWDYIKKNNLQDAKNKRNINADENLLAIFDGKNQVSMFEMPKLINNHLS
jgi:chromatin remodeling complex protein RSC6